LGLEAVKLATLAATKHIADLKDQTPHPSTPSGQIPVYKKLNQKKRKTKRGAKPGHPAARRNHLSVLIARRNTGVPNALIVADRYNDANRNAPV